jgi:hypothetical protein
MKTKITSADRLSTAALHRSGGLDSPHSRWSLRDAATGAYVDLYAITRDNDALRGNRILDIEADIPEGIYILAAGKGRDRIKQTIIVGARTD